MSQFLCDLANCISSKEVIHAPGSILGYHVVWPFRFVAVPVCGPFGLWPFRLVAVSVCGRFGLRPFRSVTVSVCGHYDLLLSITSTLVVESHWHFVYIMTNQCRILYNIKNIIGYGNWETHFGQTRFCEVWVKDGFRRNNFIPWFG